MEALSEITVWLAMSWQMFTQVFVPGIGIHFSDLYLGVFVAGLAVASFKFMLSQRVDSGDGGKKN